MGASVTACGRQITTFMIEQIGKMVSGTDVKVIKRHHVEKDGTVKNIYTTDSDVILLSDTDSVAGDSIIRTNFGKVTIQDLFNKGLNQFDAKGREFSFVEGLTSWTSNGDKAFEKPVAAIYRHKVKKAQWQIKSASGLEVRVTNDHSVMVMRDDKLGEVKPSDIIESDLLVVYLDDAATYLNPIISVEQLNDFDEYVYDIVMEDDSMPYFFANDVLVHNSCYFLTGANNKEDAIRIADKIGEDVNAMFPQFMRDTFFCNEGHDDLIKASREVVGSAGLFMDAKKKYTIKVVNLDGYDLPVPKLKSMGSEMKKADTPKVIQEFLKELMNLLLDDHEYQEIETFVNSQRGKLVRGVKNPISLGASKQINNLDAKYAEWTRVEKAGNGRVNLPGHVRAAVNYNEMAQLYIGNEATLLKAGDKGMVFYLAPNEHGLATMAFPADITAFPKWFTENFKMDKKMTESKMIDSKVKRIFDTMGWDIPTPKKAAVKKILKF